MKSALIAVAIAQQAACAPSFRSQSYFEGHPSEARNVLAECARGDHRGLECVNALAADASARRNARVRLYRQGS